MTTYFILTGIANIVLNFYILNIAESDFAKDIVDKYGKLYFYSVSFMIGFVAIPIIFGAVVCEFIKRG